MIPPWAMHFHAPAGADFGEKDRQLLNLNPLRNLHTAERAPEVFDRLNLGRAKGTVVDTYVVHVGIRAGVPWVVAEVQRSVVTGCVSGKCVLGVQGGVDITPPFA